MASHSALGLYIDGTDLKIVHVVRRGKKVVLLDLYDAKLAEKLEVAASMSGGGFDSPAEIDITQSSVQEQSVSETNSAIVTDVFTKYGRKKGPLALSIGEPYVFYHPIEIPKKLKPDRIISKIIEELQATRSGVTKEQIELLSTTSETSYIGVVREQHIPMLDLVMSARPFLGSQMPKIAFVESSDIALINVIKNNYALGEDEISVVVYVGVEYTRLIFMRGRNLFNIAPIISEGADSYSVQNTIYSRILLGQDNLSLPRVDRVILCGECKNFDIKGFLSSLLVGAYVDYLQLPRVNTSQLPAGGEELVPQYAVPIASAIRAVAPKSKNFYVANLTPSTVLESQKIFKLAWHGLVLATFVFASTFFFTYNYASNQSQLVKLRDDMNTKKIQAAEVDALRPQITDVQNQFSKYSAATTLLDSLMPNTERWSTMVASLSKAVERVGGMWLTDVHQLDTGTYSVEGYSLYRDRIPIFAMSYPGSILRKVTIADIRGKTVYNFQIDLKFSKK
jgi:hypothetical protein